MGLTVDIHIVALLVHCIRIELEFGKCCLFADRGKPEYPEKNIYKLNPHDSETWNRTRATLLGGECSHPGPIPAPLKISGKTESASISHPLQARKDSHEQWQDFYLNKSEGTDCK